MSDEKSLEVAIEADRNGGDQEKKARHTLPDPGRNAFQVRRSTEELPFIGIS
jgi:hypothetical protein